MASESLYCHKNEGRKWGWLRQTKSQMDSFLYKHALCTQIAYTLSTDTHLSLSLLHTHTSTNTHTHAQRTFTHIHTNSTELIRYFRVYIATCTIQRAFVTLYTAPIEAAVSVQTVADLPQVASPQSSSLRQRVS